MQIFTERELELLISGLPEINSDDWRASTGESFMIIASISTHVTETCPPARSRLRRVHPDGSDRTVVLEGREVVQ